MEKDVNKRRYNTLFGKDVQSKVSKVKNDVTSWYELSTIIDGKVVVLDTVDSLESAENVKERLKMKGIKVKTEEYKLKCGYPRQMGEV